MPADGGRPLAVVLLSGGMDSAVAASMMARTHELACLHATYGQRTATRERVSFGALVHHFGARYKQVVDLGHLGRMGGSALTEPQRTIPPANPESQGIPSTYVPFRNAHLLAAAVSWAEILGAGQVVIGAVEEDSSGYPDCTLPFYESFQKAVDLGTRPQTAIRLVMPVIGMSKAAIVAEGQSLGTPFHLTWSCYRHQEIACGDCDSCALRLAGFRTAGIADPLRYAPQQGTATMPASPQKQTAPSRQRRQAAALKAFLRRVRQG